MFCAECGTLNGPLHALCPGCGISVKKEPIGRGGTTQRPSLLGRLDSDRDAQEGLQELYAAAVGPKNREHYLARFALFDHRRKTSAGWHWPAFFVTLYWLLYRKMWGKAAIYFFLPYMLLVPAAALGRAVPVVVVVGYFVYVLAIFILPPLFADAAYYRHCERVIENARAVNRSQEGQLVLVAQKGGTSSVVLIVACVLGLSMVLGIFAALAMPAYKDYASRAKAPRTVNTEVGQSLRHST